MAAWTRPHSARRVLRQFSSSVQETVHETPTERGTPGAGSRSLRLHVESLEDRRLLAVVSGRHLFYNDSGTARAAALDGSDPAINANDDLAIATDKQAYRPGLSFTTNRLTNNATKNNEARVFGSHVVWQSPGGSDGGTNLEIFWYNGVTTSAANRQ